MIQIVCVGKLKGGFSYLTPGIEEYLKRLRPYVRVEIVEVADEPITATKTREQVLEKEAQRLLPFIERAGLAVALTEWGERLTSEQFAVLLGDCLNGNPSSGGTAIHPGAPMILIVGGALGLSQSVLDRCSWKLSLSPMTFPHPMVRLIVAEQLYRAVKIQRGEPYHK